MNPRPAASFAVPAAPPTRPVYLDHHATTPVDPRVATLVFETMTGVVGNAQSLDHSHGRTAARVVEQARDRVADLLHTTSSTVRFTSGATESIRIALAIAVANRPHLQVAVSRVEHKALLEPLRALQTQGRATIHWLEVDARAQLACEQLRPLLSGGIDLVCMMAANNEVGTIYPIREAAELIADSPAEFLVDATSALGQIDLDAETIEQIDYLTMSAHKIYGPKGAGALVGASVRTQFADRAAGHTGTPNVPCIAGFGEACRLIMLEGSQSCEHATGLRNRLETALLTLVPGIIINGDKANRLGNNLHISVADAPNDAVLNRLERSVAISTGAACASGAQEPSHVLRAMGLSPELQDGALRISTGKFNTTDEIDYAAAEIAKAISDVRATQRTSQ